MTGPDRDRHAASPGRRPEAMSCACVVSPGARRVISVRLPRVSGSPAKAVPGVPRASPVPGVPRRPRPRSVATGSMFHRAGDNRFDVPPCRFRRRRCRRLRGAGRTCRGGRGHRDCREPEPARSRFRHEARNRHEAGDRHEAGTGTKPGTGTGRQPATRYRSRIPRRVRPSRRAGRALAGLAHRGHVEGLDPHRRHRGSVEVVAPLARQGRLGGAHLEQPSQHADR